MSAALDRVLANVVAKDSAPFRRHAFSYLASHARPVDLAIRLHRRLPRPLAARFVAAYGWASLLRTELPDVPADVLTGGRYRNEARQFDALAEDADDLRFVPVDFEAAPTARSWSAAVRALASTKERRRLRRAADHPDFLVAARCAETVGRWLAVRDRIGRTGARVVLVSSDTNPYACALIAAARDAGLSVAYVNHGHLPDGPPPLDVDLAILDGEALLDVYRAVGPVTADVVFRGSEGAYRPMDTSGLRGDAPTIGVFASLLVDWPRLGALLPRIRDGLGAGRLLLRLHPNRTIRDPSWRSHLDLRADDVISDGAEVLLADAERCDLVIAGNSSCHLTVLKYGVPTLYLPGLDDVPHDFYRMLERRVVAAAESPEDVDRDALAAFYDDPAWATRFAAFDAAYPGRDHELRREAADALRALVGRTP